MHVPQLFQITDRSVVEHFIKNIGLATLISKASEFPVGTHVPLELEVNEKGEKVLWGHLSKANAQWKDFQKDGNVLAIFLSPLNHYISSSWYNHPNAPTWNYISIHISGKIKIIDVQKLWDSVRRLTDRYEQHERHPVSLDTLPKSVQEQMNGIVGVEISIEKTEAAFKMSQNRNDEDYKNIIKELRLKKDNIANLLADVMEKQRK